MQKTGTQLAVHKMRLLWFRSSHRNVPWGSGSLHSIARMGLGPECSFLSRAKNGRNVSSITNGYRTHTKTLNITQHRQCKYCSCNSYQSAPRGLCSVDCHQELSGLLPNSVDNVEPRLTVMYGRILAIATNFLTTDENSPNLDEKADPPPPPP